MLSLLPFSQLPADHRREAAALLFAHLPAADRNERIEQFLAAVANNELNPDTILTAWLHDCIVGVQVVEILPGKSAALWAIRSRPGDERAHFEDALLQRAVEMLRMAGAKVAQCLLLPDEPFAADALCRQGFRRLTRVNHLRAEGKGAKGAILENGTLGTLSVSFQPFAECESVVFEQTLIQSFDETLDCPELNDLRTPDEIMAGHVASAPDRSRWWLIRKDSEPAGVLILGDAALPEFWDLAYLGVIPLMRRRGIGRAAVAFAFQQISTAEKVGLTLMVDERNTPALRLYERMGFEHAGSRDVYLWISKREAASG